MTKEMFVNIINKMHKILDADNKYISKLSDLNISIEGRRPFDDFIDLIITDVLASEFSGREYKDYTGMDIDAVGVITTFIYDLNFGKCNITDWIWSHIKTPEELYDYLMGYKEIEGCENNV